MATAAFSTVFCRGIRLAASKPPSIPTTRALSSKALVALPPSTSTEPKKSDVLVVGGGNIGVFTTTLLSQSGSPYQATLLSQYAKPGKTVITYPDDKPVSASIAVIPSLSDLSSSPDFVFMCTQVAENPLKVGQLKPIFTEGTIVFFFQNGLTPSASVRGLVFNPFVDVSIAVQIRKGGHRELSVPKQVYWKFSTDVTQLHVIQKLDALIAYFNTHGMKGTASLTTNPLENARNRNVKDLFNVAGNLPSLIHSILHGKASSYEDALTDPLTAELGHRLCDLTYHIKADYFKSKLGIQFPLSLEEARAAYLAYVSTPHIPTNSNAWASLMPQEDRAGDTLKQNAALGSRYDDSLLSLCHLIQVQATDLAKSTSDSEKKEIMAAIHKNIDYIDHLMTY